MFEILLATAFHIVVLWSECEASILFLKADNHVMDYTISIWHVSYFSVAHVKLSIGVWEKCFTYGLLTCNACSAFFSVNRIHDT